MIFKDIDKDLYNKRLKIITVGFVATFALLAIVFGSVLIQLFGNTTDVAVVANLGDEPESNFKLNLLGVVIALLFCAAVLHGLRKKPFFEEVYYIWQLKQLHNLVYRKLKTIELCANKGEYKAIAILVLYYKSLKQVYTLDNNDLTMSLVNQSLSQWQEKAESLSLSVDDTLFTAENIRNIE